MRDNESINATVEIKEEQLERLINGFLRAAEHEAIRSNAIREFAERLKNSCGYSCQADGNGEIYETKVYMVSAKKIDNLVKEMVGEIK
jgi:hypothetical protein